MIIHAQTLYIDLKKTLANGLLEVDALYWFPLKAIYS